MSFGKKSGIMAGMKKEPVFCLSIDTASDTTTVVLKAMKGGFSERTLTAARGQGEALMGMIQDVLTEMNASAQDLSAIAVTLGPGSFTGVRIGLAAARGLGLALEIPVLGVSSFLATAYASGIPATVVLESKRDDYFVQRFDENCKPLSEPALKSTEDLKKLPDLLAVGSGAERLKEEIACATAEPKTSLALAAAEIALAHADWCLPPHPIYLRDADVTV